MNNEYGIRHKNNPHVYTAHTLTDAIQAWREQDFPDHWQIVERHTTRWQEVE